MMEASWIGAVGWAVAAGIVGGVWLMIMCRWISVHLHGAVKGLPPGSMGWPILGESLQLLYNHDHYIQNQRRQYGEIFKTNLLGAPTIVCLNADVNRFVLQNEGSLFAPSYPKSVNDVAGKYHILAVSGSMHKTYRGVAYALSGTAMLKEILQEVESFVVCNLDSWEGRIVNVRKEAIDIALGILMKEFFWCTPQEGSEGLSQDIQDLLQGFFTFPIKIPGSGYWKGVKAKERVAQKLTRLIEAKRLHPQKLEDDLLGKILFSEEINQMDPPLTNEQIIDMLISVLIAGYDTTANAMAVAVYLITHHPNVLLELRKEHTSVRSVKCATDKLTWLDYKSMTFTQKVINETLRLGNISPGAYRKTLQDVNCNGYIFPKGWNIITYYRATHLDPAFYPNPHELNPWRWQENDSKGHHFTPFGGGKRLCPGMELARLELSMFLHHLVTKYSWKPVGEDKLLSFPRVRMTKGYPIVVTKI